MGLFAKKLATVNKNVQQAASYKKRSFFLFQQPFGLSCCHHQTRAVKAGDGSLL